VRIALLNLQDAKCPDLIGAFFLWVHLSILWVKAFAQPLVIPANAGIRSEVARANSLWVPAFAGTTRFLPNLRECVPLHTKKSKQPRKLGQIKLHAFFGRAQGLFRAVDGTFHVFDSAMLEAPCFRIVFFPRQIVARLFQ